LIAYVKGKIAYIEDLTVVVDVNGIGYAVNVSASTIGRLPSQNENGENSQKVTTSLSEGSVAGVASAERRGFGGGQSPIDNEVQLFTYLQVTDTGQTLHGFLSQEEYRLFLRLISISGVGAKVASGILGALSPSEIVMAILSDNATALSKAPGVGKKTAQRIVLELKDKVQLSDSPWDSQGTSKENKNEKQDAMEALLALGYGRSEAMQAILEVTEDDMTANTIIRLALKKL